MVIANSRDTKNDLIQRNITSAEKINVIGNPVLPADFEKLLEDKHDYLHPWLFDSGLKVILNVGRLHEQKNQALLIKAFEKSYRKDSSLRLIILG
ncbi:glycosyltransferase, partial [Salinivibrio socompensis]|uniref:glycosyltransferase n=1 Tax=Salinivibrio socompensis TaxID=1510206 RepID=UPI00047120A4